jgi:hypothetical protein
VVYTPQWITPQKCGVPKNYLDKVFAFMARSGYTATRELQGCHCMEAEIDICCTDDMIGREALCIHCARRCSECDEPNLEFFKSKEDTPVCYRCARYHYGCKKTEWTRADWKRWDENDEYRPGEDDDDDDDNNNK